MNLFWQAGILFFCFSIKKLYPPIRKKNSIPTRESRCTFLFVYFLCWPTQREHLFWPPSMVYISFSGTQYILQIACWAFEGSFHVLSSPPALWLVGTPQVSVSMLRACLLIYPVRQSVHLSSLVIQHLRLHFWWFIYV